MSDNSSTNEMIAALWQRNQPLILERLAQLDGAAAAAASGTLSDEVRAEAESTAHKLSGSLGMFGYQVGTEHARTLEQELQRATPSAEKLKDHAVLLRATLGL